MSTKQPPKPLLSALSRVKHRIKHSGDGSSKSHVNLRHRLIRNPQPDPVDPKASRRSAFNRLENCLCNGPDSYPLKTSLLDCGLGDSLRNRDKCPRARRVRRTFSKCEEERLNRQPLRLPHPVHEHRPRYRRAPVQKLFPSLRDLAYRRQREL